MGFQSDHPVYYAIRRDYETGRLAPESTLNIGALAKQYIYSSVPVREALIRLTAEDIAELVPGRGFQIRKIGCKEVENHYRIFRLLFLDSIENLQSMPQTYIRQRIEQYKSRLIVPDVSKKSCPDYKEDRLVVLGKFIMNTTAYAIYERSLLITRPLRWSCYDNPNLEPDILKHLSTFLEHLEASAFDDARASVVAYFQERQNCLPAIYEKYRCQFF